MTMEFHVLTIFPGMFESPFRWGVLSKALDKKVIRLFVHDIRDHAVGNHRVTDDYPYGGREGMVMKPEPIFAAVESARAMGARGPVILLSPQGEIFDFKITRQLSTLPDLILLCGRYEGVDERVRVGCVDRELSIGDYIITGGELAAMVVIDAVARLVGGVLGNEDSSERDTFERGLLKYPQYTRPPVYRGMAVPDVLLSGDHHAIARWRCKESLRRTMERRMDLLMQAPLTDEEQGFLEELRSEVHLKRND